MPIAMSGVKSYYNSIDHHILYDILYVYVTDRRVLRLLWDYMRRTVRDDGTYQEVQRGISLGCPLSPLMGALYLKPLDDRMAETGLFYARFMDDWVVLAPSRWKLRRAIKAAKETLAGLKVECHPEKTFIGRIVRGFDFLGYAFSPAGLGIARKTIERFVARVTRLYEQGADGIRIGEYVRRWRRWVRTGVGLAGRCVEFLGVQPNLLTMPEPTAISSTILWTIGWFSPQPLETAQSH